MTRWIIASVVSLVGCADVVEAPDPPPYPPPLATLDGNLQFALHPYGYLDVYVRTSRCTELEPTVQMTVDGIPADEAFHGGHTSGDDQGAAGVCLSPTFTWNAREVPGVATFVLTDGETTWTAKIDQPFAQRTLQMIAPTEPLLHTGDRVVLRVSPGNIELESGNVSFTTPSHQRVELDGYYPEVEGNEVRFTIPELTTSEPAVMEVFASGIIDVVSCDAPRGCNTIDHPSTDFDVELSASAP